MCLQLSLEVTAKGSRTDPNKPNQFIEGTDLELNCIPSDDDAVVVWKRVDDSVPADSYQNDTVLV